MANGVGTSFFAMVLEDQHVAHPLIALQIDYALHVSPDCVKDFVDGLGPGETCERSEQARATKTSPSSAGACA